MDKLRYQAMLAKQHSINAQKLAAKKASEELAALKAEEAAANAAREAYEIAAKKAAEEEAAAIRQIAEVAAVRAGVGASSADPVPKATDKMAISMFI
jgi:uncharacterized protein YdaU (DUF1376 family)